MKKWPAGTRVVCKTPYLMEQMGAGVGIVKGYGRNKDNEFCYLVLFPDASVFLNLWHPGNLDRFEDPFVTFAREVIEKKEKERRSKRCYKTRHS